MKTDAIDKAIESYLKIDEGITEIEYSNFNYWEKQLYAAYWSKKKYDGYPLEVIDMEEADGWSSDKDTEHCNVDCLYRICPNIVRLDEFLKHYAQANDKSSPFIPYDSHFLLDLHEYMTDEIYIKTKGEYDGF